MAERYEVIVDFARYPIGTRVVLQNLGPENNADFETTGVVMAFDVAAEAAHTLDNTIPPVIDPDNEVMRLTPSQAVTTRHMRFKRQGGQWTIDGQTWEDVINSGFTKVVANPKLGDVEIWELENSSNGWFHPVHIHLVDFQILDRNGGPPLPYERGPKDVVYVGEGETVRVLMRFGPQIGRYMIHCHNLVHEDHDMMVQFEVGEGGHHPIEHDRPRHQPAPEMHGDEDRGPGPSPSSGPGSGPGPGSAPAQPPQTIAGSVKPKPKPKRKVKVKGTKVRKRKRKPTRKKRKSRRRRPTGARPPGSRR